MVSAYASCGCDAYVSCGYDAYASCGYAVVFVWFAVAFVWSEGVVWKEWPCGWGVLVVLLEAPVVLVQW